VLNETADLTYVEYRGRLDPPLPEYVGVAALFILGSLCLLFPPWFYFRRSVVVLRVLLGCFYWPFV
jgi:hypothetical protein